MYSRNSDSVHVGIVLQFMQHKSRITVLDRKLGKIHGVCFTRISPGECVTYIRRPSSRGLDLITFKNRIYTSLDLARGHIMFLHHVLEICIYGLPLESAAPDVFSLVASLYARDTVDDWFKTVFLAKLVILLGLQTAQTILCDLCTASLHQVSIDSIGTLFLDSKCTQRIQRWLYYCLMEHMPHETLKTLSFCKKE